MDNYTNLKPNFRVLELLGGTGNGKTEIATVPADPRARKILVQGVGSTNSTLTERLMVFTTAYNDKMVVAVKYDDNAFSRNLFTEIVSKAIAKAVISLGKAAPTNKDDGKNENDKNKKVLEEALREQLDKRNNAKAILSLLAHDKKNAFVDGIVDLFGRGEYDLLQYSYNIYNTVKNDMAEGEVRVNSRKFLSAVQQEVECTMDLQSETFKAKIWDIWKNLNRNLKDIFLSYFREENKSNDQYYYKEILLENPDNEFIHAMFTANNMQAGQRLSLEVLCSEIVIYVPMHEKFSEVISEKQSLESVFSDSEGNFAFAILDTRGLYHSANTDDENADYCSELLYKGDIDAIAMIVPLEGDTNEKKIGELYRDVLKNFNKQIPVFTIHNKLDLFIASLQKKVFDDPLSLDSFEEKEIEDSVLDKEIKVRMEELIEGIGGMQVKEQLPCYLKRDASFPAAFVKRYNVIETYKIILEDMAKSLEDSACKIKFEPEEGEVPTLTVKRNRLAELIHVHVTESSTDKKVFTPGMFDITLSLGKTPHGNSYNALRRRLRKGDGYTSNIDEAYFYNCKSFSVNFTANLRNFASPEFIHLVVNETLSVNGVKKTQEATNDRYRKAVEKYVNPKELVSRLLFYKAIQDAEQVAFSYRSKFQKFLQNSMKYFNRAMIDEEAYIDAIEQIILEAAQKALDLNVTFK